MPTTLEPLDCPAPLRAVADAARRVIFDSVPGVEERIYKGRTAAGYHDRQVGAFCGLFVTRRSVRLEFPRGARLSKPERILRDGRYVELLPGKRVARAPLARVIHGAILAGL